MLWYLDDKGQLNVVRVRTGLTDGQRTVVESQRIKEGMQVIVAVNSPAQGSAAAATPVRRAGRLRWPAGRVDSLAAAALDGFERERSRYPA